MLSLAALGNLTPTPGRSRRGAGYHHGMTRSPEPVAQLTDAHRAAVANLTRATALLPAQRRREKLLALGIAMGLERAAAICIDAQRQQDVLRGDAVAAIHAAVKIRAYARAWREASEEKAPVSILAPRPRRRIVGVAH